MSLLLPLFFIIVTMWNNCFSSSARGIDLPARARPWQGAGGIDKVTRTFTQRRHHQLPQTEYYSPWWLAVQVVRCIDLSARFPLPSLQSTPVSLSPSFLLPQWRGRKKQIRQKAIRACTSTAAVGRCCRGAVELKTIGLGRRTRRLYNQVGEKRGRR